MSTNALSFSDPTLHSSSMSGASTGVLNSGLNLSMGSPAAPTGLQPAGVAVQPAQVPGANTGAAGGAAAGGSFWKQKNGDWNTNNMELALGGAQLLGSLWNAYNQHKIAKEQMSFARSTFDTNLANQKQTYNTALEDRIRARHNTEGRNTGETDAYLNKHSL
jgi:hypothetical protein